MIQFTKLIVLLGAFLMHGSSFAQYDLGAWTGLDIRLPLTKKLETGIDMQIRYDDNISSVDEHFISPYFKYKLNKRLSFGADYRLSNLPETGFMGTTRHHRFTLDAQADISRLLSNKGSGDWEQKSTVRLRFTHQYRGGDLNNDNLRFRWKYAVTSPNKKWSPYFLTELFLHFNDQLIYTSSEVRSVHRFNKVRFRTGVAYNFNKRNELNAFYIVQPEFESADTDFIIGLSYQYKFKRLNRKK